MSLDEYPLHGLLLVDKPGSVAAFAEPFPGSGDVATPTLPPFPTDGTRLLTSHDVVQRVRRYSGQRRIGHTGTLDPMAGGLLVLCLGWATRLVEFYQGHDKEYTAEITLGVATDTYDAQGTVLERLPVPPLNELLIENALARFLGTVEQKPPVFSALKQGGESLHHKARRGEEVDIPARSVTFYEMELLAIAPPDRFTLRVRCSAGTYIRSLAMDLGKALGTVATLSKLRRVSAGPFRVDNAHTLEGIERHAAAQTLPQLLLPPGTNLGLPVLPLSRPEEARDLGHGKIVPMQGIVAHTQTGTLAALQDESGRLLGIVRCLQPAHPGALALWKADKWFAA